MRAMPEPTLTPLLALAAHPDARGWIGAGGPHSNFFARMRVKKVYAFVRRGSPFSLQPCARPASFPR